MACDICLGELDTEPESTVIAQKILSCVARVKESYGVRHVVSVLRGEKDERIVRLKHNELSTFGLLSNSTRVQIRDWIMQLVSVKLLDQTSEDYPVLKLTPGAWEVLRGKRGVMLTRAAKKKRRRDQRIKIESAEISRDQALFHQLRDLRRRIATEIRKPPYIIFDDRTLQEMARTQPSTPEEMRRLPGIGAMKMESYGERFLAEIRTFLGR